MRNKAITGRVGGELQTAIEKFIQISPKQFSKINLLNRTETKEGKKGKKEVGGWSSRKETSKKFLTADGKHFSASLTPPPCPRSLVLWNVKKKFFGFCVGFDNHTNGRYITCRRFVVWRRKLKGFCCFRPKQFRPWTIECRSTSISRFPSLEKRRVTKRPQSFYSPWTTFCNYIHSNFSVACSSPRIIPIRTFFISILLSRLSVHMPKASCAWLHNSNEKPSRGCRLPCYNRCVCSTIALRLEM